MIYFRTLLVYYNYLNQTGTYTVDGTDDVQELKDTLVSTGNLHVY
jgi:hypothetical protein